MTAHALERLIGLWLLLAASGALLTYGLVAWYTRDERRTATEPRLPRLTVRVNDLLETNALAEPRRVGRYTP